MDFDLTLAPDRSYAILTNHRDVTLQSAQERQRAMQAFATAHNVWRFLIDTREMRFTGGIIGLYTFGRDTLPNEGFDFKWKVALVTSPNDDSHDFLETVCQNVGYQVRVFNHYDEARTWLCRGRESQL
jgi:hypothetical protein